MTLYMGYILANFMTWASNTTGRKVVSTNKSIAYKRVIWPSFLELLLEKE